MSQEIIAELDTQEVRRPLRTGVVICDCGGRISSVIDTGALCQQIAGLPEVTFVTHEAFPCSKDGQQRISQAIKANGLERVLVAGCSPRLVRSMFRKTAVSAGLMENFLNMANIREQCAYVHGEDPGIALEKAADLIEMGLARLETTSPALPHSGQVVKAALLIGADLGGLTIAQTLAESGIRVVIVEQAEHFGDAVPDDLQKSTRQQIIDKGETLRRHPMIDVLFNAHVLEVTGHPGDYQVRIKRGDLVSTYSVGAIIVANAVKPKELGQNQWFDRSRVKTQAEFQNELEQATEAGKWLEHKNIVMLFCAEEGQRQKCSRVCCNIGIRQAIQARHMNPDTSITVLFRDLYFGGIGEAYESEFIEARKLGVTFFRYRRDRPPVIGDQTVDVLDTLTGEAVRLPYDRVVLTMPMVPQVNAQAMGSLLGLPLDEDGFLAEPRLRLRPHHYAEPGIYALGSAQQPADTAEALFQAYLTSARVMRFLSQDTIRVETPAARINPSLCTGCGNCVQVCPFDAIHLEKRDGVLSLSQVDEMRCVACGNCVVVCPSKSINLPGWDDAEIPAQIDAALHPYTSCGKVQQPTVVALTCEWSAYAAADMAGARRLPYPANVRIIRMNCSARFDPYHVLWAFINGADGVYLGACPPGECHYGTGNLYAKERVELLKQKLSQHGVDPRRLHLEYLSVDDGKKFAESLTSFVDEIKNIVP